jgi:hypothetical protein
MTRREALLALMLSPAGASAQRLAVALAPVAARAQPLDLGDARPGIAPGGRPGVDEALRRTVSLVLRAEARAGTLPPSMTEAVALPEDMLGRIVAGDRLPEDIPIEPAPHAVNRRLPHARSSSVWVIAGTWLVEINPVRRTVLSIAHDVLPPSL